MEKKIYIYANDTQMSKATEETVRKKLLQSGFGVYGTLTEDTDLIICIGGDGTLLRLLREFAFPKIPIVGINTGHLGFFQEILPEQLDEFIFLYSQNRYSIQQLNGVTASVVCGEDTAKHIALNEITVRGLMTHPVHLNISINDSFIERFSGDGICVNTPAGSTAYNYALGGSIVDPRLNLLQVTPIAPMHNTAYRSFTSSILVPSRDCLSVVPCGEYDSSLTVVCDGAVFDYEGVSELTVRLSRKKINLMRFDNYRFWEKVKSKFL